MSLNFNNKYFVKSAMLILVLLLQSVSFSQQVKLVNDGKYIYQTVENDPVNARIYTLENGLKVYMSVNKNEPRIQTFIAVATGSKNDPHDAQGLSHYLEHMLFKGTDKFGTKNYDAEKPFLDTIISLYEQRRKTTDTAERRMIYHRIDSVSYLASDYAIANEYDKMLASIGGQGTNAYTSFEETVYVEDIPSNQIKRWLEIESERFRNPVMRLFHTELEAVYEEKNMGLDNDNSKVWESFYEGLFPTHTYGTQTTIGSVEQLKNPSIQKIIDYYNERYVPNNMAICLAGDLNPDETIRLIDEYFGIYKMKPVPEFNPPVEAPITSPVIKTVYGPSQESMRFGYRFAGAGTKDADMITLLEYIMSNGTAGLIDLNLNQDQKVIDAYASTDINKDYSILYFGGKPREGQTLDEVKDLIMNQIENVKKGNFPDWLIPAVILNFRMNQIRAFEKNEDRADAFVSCFALGVPWERYIFNIDRLSQISKEDIIKFAQENLNDDYVIVYKKTGEDKSIVKVDKPEINPVKVNRDDKSEFLQEIVTEPSSDIEPVFMDFKNEISEAKIKKDIPVYYVKNKDNELYNLSFVINYGTNNNRKLGLAMDYLKYLGTSKYTSAQIQEEFYKLAGSFDVGYGEDETTISISGMNENLGKSLKLLEELISNPKPDEEALQNLVADILKQRENAKLNKRIIKSALLSFGKYGKDNPFTYRLSEEELKIIKPDELIKIIKEIFSYSQRILYFGPEELNSIIKIADSDHNVPVKLKSVSENDKFKERDISENEVYVVNYDMQQAEIVMISKSEKYDKNKIPLISIFNEYFGGGMQSIVFQELRESKALAYDAYSFYQTPYKKDKPNYIVAYIGTQADKLPESMKGMTELLNDLPLSENIFNNAKDLLIKQIQTERVPPNGILNQFESSKKLGLDYDIRKDIYRQIPEYKLDDIKTFQEKYIKGKKYIIMVLGDLKKLDMSTLEKYGNVKILTLKEIFGY